MKLLFFFVSLFAIATLSFADDNEPDERWYHVEVIIFAHVSDMGVHEEYWPLETGEPDVSDSVLLVEQDNSSERLPGELLEFEVLPVETLSNAFDRMQRSALYDVIYANAWRLPDLPAKFAPSVRIRAGKRYHRDGSFAIPAMIEGTTRFNREFEDALYEIDGRIKISLSKFLDVDVDLLYRRHIKLTGHENMEATQFHPFRLTEFRRMASNTIHYLDHPMFGVVVAINRYDPEKDGYKPELIAPETAAAKAISP